MDETKPKKRGPGRPRKLKPEPEPEPKRRTRYWDPTTHDAFKIRTRAFLVALNVSQAGHDHIADLKVVDKTADELIAMINEYRGLP
jgi:hypothetical protein